MRLPRVIYFLHDAHFGCYWAAKLYCLKGCKQFKEFVFAARACSLLLSGLDLNSSGWLPCLCIFEWEYTWQSPRPRPLVCFFKEIVFAISKLGFAQLTYFFHALPSLMPVIPHSVFSFSPACISLLFAIFPFVFPVQPSHPPSPSSRTSPKILIGSTTISLFLAASSKVNACKTSQITFVSISHASGHRF